MKSASVLALSLSTLVAATPMRKGKVIERGLENLLPRHEQSCIPKHGDCREEFASCCPGLHCGGALVVRVCLEDTPPTAGATATTAPPTDAVMATTASGSISWGTASPTSGSISSGTASAIPSPSDPAQCLKHGDLCAVDGESIGTCCKGKCVDVEIVGRGTMGICQAQQPVVPSPTSLMGL